MERLQDGARCLDHYCVRISVAGGCSDFICHKTLWDWMQLLIIPLALAAIALLFNRSERIRQDKLADRREKEARLIEERREKEADLIERRRTQDSSLQSYLDEMAQFLLYRDDATGKLLVRVEPGPGVQSVLTADCVSSGPTRK